MPYSWQFFMGDKYKEFKIFVKKNELVKQGQTATPGTACPTQRYVWGFFKVSCGSCNTEEAGEIRALLFSISVWVLLSPLLTMLHWRCGRRGLRLIICRCNFKGSTFSLVILRPWLLTLSGIEPSIFRIAVWRSTKTLNHHDIFPLSRNNNN